MARPYALTAVKGGINRQRVKGAARQDTLYDLVNAYVSDDKTIVVRPGSVKTATLPAGTKGLTSFNGELHVFASSTLEVPDGYVLHVIAHPDGDGSAINRIWFAEPYMGFLYVVADFVGHTGTYYHFWLQTGDEWQADHIYKHGDVIVPTAANGFAYQASRLNAPNLSWAPGVQRTVGDIIEPTVYNDYQYEVIDTLGTNPRSGDTEPEWPVEDGAQISEDADGLGSVASGDTTETPDNDTTPNPDTVDRYGSGNQ